MQNRLKFVPFSCLLIGLLLPLHAQEPLKAEAVDEGELRADPGNTFFARGKNLYDEAQRSTELDARRALHMDSAEIFSRYLREFPDHANAEPAWWYLGSSYYQAGLINEAKRCFSVLLNRYKDGKYASAAAYTMAADHYNQREYGLAAPLFERFAETAARPSDKAKGNLFAGNCYRLMGRERQAIEAYQRVVEDPEGELFRDQARLSIATLTQKQGKLDEALKLFIQVADSEALDKYRAEAALQAALIAKKTDQPKIAEKYLRFILDNPGMKQFGPDAQIALMEKLYEEEEYKKLLALFNDSSIKAEGEKEAARLMIAARAMLKLSQPEKASDLFRQVERLVPPENDLAFQASYYRLNCFFQIEGKYVVDQVDAFLQIYEASRPKDTRIHTALLIKAETLFAENKLAEAAEAYSKINPALLSESNRPGFLYQRGWCLSDVGDLKGAVRSLSDFIKNYPQDKRVYPALVKRAKAYMELGEPPLAIADYDRLAMDEAAPQDMVSIAWLESARTRRKEGNIKNMLIRYKALLDNVEDLAINLTAEANYWIGWGMVKENQPKDATPYLDRARELRQKAYGKHAGLLLALSYYAAQNPDKLAEEIELAISSGYANEIPKQAVRWSGMQSYNSGNFETAAKFLGLTSNSEEPRTTPKEVWRYLGKALLETGEFSKALESISNVLEVEDNMAWKADALLDKSKALYRLERFDEARKVTNEAFDLRPQGRISAGLRIVSGNLHTKSGKLGEAAADYLYVIQFHEDAEIKPLAIHKYIGVLETQGKAEEAEKYRTQLKTGFPDWKAP
jgi:tetratricopeptide (TPR) repeat protein